MAMERLRTILTPSPMQYVICSLLAVLTFGVIYGSTIIGRFFSGQTATYVEESYGAQLVKLNEIGLVRTGVIVVFWAIVGLAAYGAYLIITNAIVEARNEVVINTAYANKGTKLSSFRGAALQLGCGLLLITVVVFSVLVLLPIWSWLFEASIFHDLNVLSIISSLGGIMALAANMYGIWSLFQITWVADKL
jgi:hypothetical protein